MILPDHEIMRLAKAGMIEPFNESQLNPASYNVRIGDSFLREISPFDRLLNEGCFRLLSVGGYIMLNPGEFILAATQEIFNLPDDICAKFALRSTWARKGLEHAMAGFCDPGWHGSALTMELKNNLRYNCITIPIGECIGQMVFMRMESKPGKTYRETGRYNNDKQVMGAKE